MDQKKYPALSAVLASTSALEQVLAKGYKDYSNEELVEMISKEAAKKNSKKLEKLRRELAYRKIHPFPTQEKGKFKKSWEGTWYTGMPKNKAKTTTPAAVTAAPRDVTIQVMKFEELNPKVQQKVLDRFREDAFEPQFITEDFEENLTEWGLQDPKVYWSLSSSQGDGVAFEGSMDPDKFLGGTEFEKYIPNIYKISVTHEGRYYHWNSMKVAVDENDPEQAMPPEEYKKLEEFLKEKIQAKSRELEKAGYDVIEYQTSDEVIKENIAANEYEFYQDGRIFHE
jgi:hypothetical protein